MLQAKGWHLFLIGGGLIVGAVLYSLLDLGRTQPLVYVIVVTVAVIGGACLGFWIANRRTVSTVDHLAPAGAIQSEFHLTSTLTRLTKIVNSTLELNQVLSLALEQLAQVMQYDLASILLDEEQGLMIAACRGQIDCEDLVGTIVVTAKDDSIDQVMQSQQTRVISDVQRVGNWANLYARKNGQQPTRAWIGTPLVAQNKSIGVLIIEKQEPNFYSAGDGELAATFAAQIATAVQNARLFRDVRHKALEAAVMADNLNEEKRKLDAILRHIADGLVVTDAEGTIRLVNPAFEQMFSHPTTTLADRSLTQIDELQRLIKNALADQETMVTDISLSDGRILRASLGIIQEETRTLGVVSVLRDITHEKEVDRMKSEFISTVSHELRTPLTSVLGFTKHINKIFHKRIVPNFLAGDQKAQQTLQHISEELEIVVSEGERLTRLINDLLDIAKMEAGKLEWHMTETSIANIIPRAVSAISALATAKNLTIDVEIKESLPPIWADEDRLIQVITNLLSNAVKFTEAGYIRVQAFHLEIFENGTMTPLGIEPLKIQSTAMLQPGHWLVVSIQDTGIGISEKNLPYVFEKFRQVGDVLTDRPDGTGLGIPICKEIVEQHKGRIWANSELGVGSTFTFALPLAPEAKSKSFIPAKQSSRANPMLEASRLGQLILVADDDANIRYLLRQQLTEAGYEVIEATNGLATLAKVRQEKPDLIILDVMMPGLNGFDVASILKGDQATLHIPILILSIIEDKERVPHLDVNEYLTKPWKPEELLQSIAMLLAQAQPGKRQEKVLIINDNPTSLETMMALLQEKGYDVVEACDEQQGLRRAEQERPDFIILNMPEIINQDDILGRLRYKTGIRNAPIIVLTNVVTPEEVAQILDQAVMVE